MGLRPAVAGASQGTIRQFGEGRIRKEAGTNCSLGNILPRRARTQESVPSSLSWNSSSNAPVPAGQSKEKGSPGPERLVPEVGKMCISMPRKYEAMQLKLTPPHPLTFPLSFRPSSLLSLEAFLGPKKKNAWKKASS